MKFGSSNCDQDATLVIGPFSPSGIEILVNFDYGYDDYDEIDEFNVFLYNETQDRLKLIY